ncbi:MAG: PDGLE domain-containing protein [Ilumatobacteraceae bacterium]
MAFVLAGIAVAVVLVLVLAPNANPNPDGLEKVAGDKGIDAGVTDHAFVDGPFADYGVTGVDNTYVATWIAGLLGVAATFAIGAGIVLLLRRLRPSDPSRPSTTTPTPT